MKKIEEEFKIDQKQFENMWTIFFNVYETLDSFSGHLAKAIWDRTEVFYEFLAKNNLKFQ